VKSKIGYRAVIFAIALIFGIVYSIPSLLDTKSGSKISLGLDLQGGMHMLLGVKTEEAVEAKVKSIAASISYYCEANDILIDELTFDESHISFELLDEDEKESLQTHFDKTEGLIITTDAQNYNITLTEEEIKITEDFAILQSVETIRNRLDQFGLAEPTVARQGADKILVELPGIKTQEDEQRARKLIGKTAHLELTSVDEKNNARVYMLDENIARSMGNTIVEDVKEEGKLYLLRQIPIIDGTMLTDAKVGYDESNQPVINFSLDSQGGEIFGNFTGKNVGNRLAIVLDKKVYSAPVIRERIGGGSGQIIGIMAAFERGAAAENIGGGQIQHLSAETVAFPMDQVQHATGIALIKGIVFGRGRYAFITLLPAENQPPETATAEEVIHYRIDRKGRHRTAAVAPAAAQIESDPEIVKCGIDKFAVIGILEEDAQSGYFFEQAIDHLDTAEAEPGIDRGVGRVVVILAESGNTHKGGFKAAG